MTLIKKRKYLRRPTARRRHYSFANNLRSTPMTLRANSRFILMDRRISDSSEQFSNALSNASSIIGLYILKGLLVYSTN